MNTERIEEIAQAAHEVNRIYCEALGDNSQLPWAQAPDWQKESAIAGVRAYAMNPDRSPEGAHKAWWSHKQADGWRYGPKKDPDAKTHPCMVPYAELPPEQQAKDHIFRAVALGMLGQPLKVTT